MRAFEEGPTPWTDAHADELAYDEEEIDLDMVRRLERRCRAAEALLQEIANECCGCPFDDCLHDRTRKHLEAAKEMDR